MSPFSSKSEILCHFDKCNKAGFCTVDIELLKEHLENGGLDSIILKSEENCKIIYEKTRQDLRTTSFSRRYNSILMWSHYSQNHKGFCLKFDCHSLGFDGHFHKVMYRKSNKLRTLKPNDYFDRPEGWYFEQMLLTKHRGWRYEKEWRVITKQQQIPYEREAVVQILLGCNSSDPLLRELKLLFPTAEILKAERAIDRFSLRFVRI